MIRRLRLGDPGLRCLRFALAGNLRTRNVNRPGITLLEVVVALAIFLFSIVAIWQLVVFGSDRALDVKYTSKASLLCQRELAKVASRVSDLSSVAMTTVPDEENWQYEVVVTDGELDGLKKVTVTVRREREDGRVTEASLTQLVFDPTLRGSSLDQPATAGTTPATPADPAADAANMNTGANNGGANNGGANNGGANNGGNNNNGGTNKGGGNAGKGGNNGGRNNNGGNQGNQGQGNQGGGGAAGPPRGTSSTGGAVPPPGGGGKGGGP